MPKRINTHRSLAQPDKKAQAKQYDRYRIEDHAFYTSTRWIRVRLDKLSINPLCEECERHGIVTAADTVHHKQERIDRPDLSLDLDNLESVCRQCHGAKRDLPNM